MNRFTFQQLTDPTLLSPSLIPLQPAACPPGTEIKTTILYNLCQSKWSRKGNQRLEQAIKCIFARCCNTVCYTVKRSLSDVKSCRVFNGSLLSSLHSLGGFLVAQKEQNHMSFIGAVMCFISLIGCHLLCLILSLTRHCSRLMCTHISSQADEGQLVLVLGVKMLTDHHHLSLSTLEMPFIQQVYNVCDQFNYNCDINRKHRIDTLGVQLNISCHYLAPFIVARRYITSYATTEPFRPQTIAQPHVGLGSWFRWEMRNGQKLAVVSKSGVSFLKVISEAIQAAHRIRGC